MKYPVVINQSEYGFDAHCPVLPGCHSQGDTLEEALENIKDAIQVYLKTIAIETKDAAVYQVEVSV
ncbi:MAG: type II toxin-antitoxin system HicB family antitoxin [Thermodesulfovibrionales bacterium]|nr:type II toxin-antitoxin system HicB family antitoxin [Thermodesulfovibrionales bacterium]